MTIIGVLFNPFLRGRTYSKYDSNAIYKGEGGSLSNLPRSFILVTIITSAAVVLKRAMKLIIIDQNYCPFYEADVSTCPNYQFVSIISVAIHHIYQKIILETFFF